MLAQSHRTVVDLLACGDDGGAIEHGLACDGQGTTAKHGLVEMHLCACEARVGWQNHRAVVGLRSTGGNSIHRQCRAAQRQVGSVAHTDQTNHVIACVVQAHDGIGHCHAGCPRRNNSGAR